MAQVTDAVIHMHLKGVVHCHISPDSVVLAQPGNLDSVLIGNFDSAQVRRRWWCPTPAQCRILNVRFWGHE